MAAKHIIIVAYAIAPGPGGPEGHVNARFLQALANFWPAGVSVITAGGSPTNDRGVLLAELPGWRYHSLGETGADSIRATWLSKFAAWSLTQIRDRKSGRFLAKTFNRIIYWLTGSGLKMTAWQYTARRTLQKELQAHPEAIVYSRALPFESIIAVAGIRKKHSFAWFVNINDPLPPDVWGGLYQTERWRNARVRATFKKILPRIDAFTFPSRRLRDLEVAAFPDLQNVPRVILPHLTNRVPNSQRLGDPSNDKGNELQIAFAGTLRKKRLHWELAMALEDFVSESLQLAKDLRIIFHLARPNPFAEEFIRSLPIHTEVTLGYFDDQLDRQLVRADVLLDLEAEEDKPLSLTKVVNYLGYQKPIWAICMPNGTTWELVQKHNCGYLSPLGDREAILSTLQTIYRDWLQENLKQRIPNPEVLERFGPEAQIEDLLALSAYLGDKGVESEQARALPLKDWP